MSASQLAFVLAAGQSKRMNASCDALI